ncbi:metal ABC transporter ATP-binding protein [Staphylospora marina]|uniref:metal ABC transporter ATP-binding protein n=1 Tax=Staphylospora marina TaxID=2490858 RepID=UPI000F5C0E99|nr:metal ABC transporter ATP-binding protein [Staphylospora marina]
MKTDAVMIRNLHFSYGEHPVLDGIHLDVKAGEFLGVVGPNGSGKSTLVRCMLGLLKPDQGEVRLFGEPAHLLKDRGRVGYVSQKANSFNLHFPATVREVVLSGLSGKLGLFRRFKKEHHRRVERVLDQVGLADLADRNIGLLSGGQQQRVFIARALVQEPELLILDEPTVGVDARSTDRFYELLSGLHEQGLTLILITHDIGAVTSLVQRVACLNKKLFFHGDACEFARQAEEILSEAYRHEIRVMNHRH